MMKARPIGLLAVLAMLCSAQAGRAQAPDCTYDRCALRLQSRVFSENVVQGAGATPVGRLGLFAPRIEPLASAGDTARHYYESFRVHQNRGGILATVGALASVASLIVLASSDFPFNEPSDATAFWGLLVVGAGFEIAGGVNIRIGRDHLHRAIWFYNRSLVVGR